MAYEKSRKVLKFNYPKKMIENQPEIAKPNKKKTTFDDLRCAQAHIKQQQNS